MESEQPSSSAHVGASGIVVAKGETASTAMAAQAQAQVQARFVMALRNPRNTEQVRIELLRACDSRAFADAAVYSVPRGGKSIEGPSVRFAEACVQIMGNLSVESLITFEDEKKRIVRVVGVDYEKNSAVAREITIERTIERQDPKGREVLSERANSYGKKVYLVEANDDEMAMKSNALESKTFRTVALRLIPFHLVAEAIERCETTLAKSDAADPAAALRRVTDAFAKVNVFPNELEKYLGHSLATASPVEIAELRKVYQAVTEGTSWAEVLSSRLTAETSAPAPASVSQSTPTPTPQPVAARDVAQSEKTPQQGTDAFGDWLVQEYKNASTKERVAKLAILHGSAPETWQESIGKAYQAALKRVKS